MKKHHKQGEKPTTPEFSEVDHRCDSIMGLVSIEFNKNNWVKAYEQCEIIVNDANNKDYARWDDAQDTLELCRTNYCQYCMSCAVPGSQFSKKEDAIEWVEAEMGKVGRSLTDDDKKVIENKFPTLPPQNSTAKQTTISQKDTYHIEVWQNNKKINKITTKAKLTFKLFDSNNNCIKKEDVEWNYTINGGGNYNDPEPTPQADNKNFQINCTYQGHTYRKNIECDIKSSAAGNDI